MTFLNLFTYPTPHPMLIVTAPSLLPCILLFSLACLSIWILLIRITYKVAIPSQKLPMDKHCTMQRLSKMMQLTHIAPSHKPKTRKSDITFCNKVSFGLKQYRHFVWIPQDMRHVLQPGTYQNPPKEPGELLSEGQVQRKTCHRVCWL